HARRWLRRSEYSAWISMIQRTHESSDPSAFLISACATDRDTSRIKPHHLNKLHVSTEADSNRVGAALPAPLRFTSIDTRCHDRHRAARDVPALPAIGSAA